MLNRCSIKKIVAVKKMLNLAPRSYLPAETYYFFMQEGKKGWRIIYPPKLPGWIYNYEAYLSEIIRKYNGTIFPFLIR